MSITTVTHLHAASDQQDDLAQLLAAGRDRMRAAEGCESFDLLRDEDDPCAMAFLQRWVSHEAHDAAFAERIVQSGHLDKVLAVLDEPIVQHTYHVAS
ncbi:MAG TPA: antibiotic biosynthesis monooxygenase family protein [Acidimicrobiales bacterium]